MRDERISILLLEDDPNDAELLLVHLKRAGLDVVGRLARSAAEFTGALEEQRPDIILADYQLPSFRAIDALRLLREREMDVPVIVITGALSDDDARACMDLGAADYLLKDRLARLGPAVVRAHLEHKLQVEKREAVASLSRMAAVIEATSDLVAMADRGGRILFMNRAGRRMAGYGEEDDLSGLSFRDFFAERARKAIVQEALPTALRVGSWRGDSLLLRQDGGELAVSQVIIAHRDGGETYFSTIIRDMTDRIRSEEALRQSQAWLQAVWENSGDGMRLSDRSGMVRAVNSEFCRIVGISEAELLGEPFWVIFPEEADFTTIRARYEQRFAEGTPLVRSEARMLFRNNKEIDAEVTFSCIDVEGGERFLLTILRDISERKRLEMQFLRSQRMESIGALAGGIAHDFNNILAPVFMAASMLRMPLSAADREKALRTVEESAQRGGEVVRRLLGFAKGIEGERKRVNPSGLVEEVGRIVEQSFPRNIRLEVNIAPGLKQVEVDSTQIHQVLLNLCVNARDAMPRGGRLCLEAQNADIGADKIPPGPHTRSGQFVVLRVADTGIGISPENQERVFDPFFSTKESTSGTGLGLSTSLAIVRAHGGFIAVESAPGRGARFDVYLPVCSERPQIESHRPAPRDHSDGRGEIVLVVDDESPVRDVACRVLEKCGYRAIGAGTGEQALAILAERDDVAAILTDVLMPRMDGVRLLREVRKLRPDLPAAAMSGNLEQYHQAGLQELGVHELVDKPFDAGRLLRAIDALLRR